MQYGLLSTLLVGDLESTGEEALLELSLINKVDLLKVGHHGAKTSSGLPFLLETRPETSLISVGENNKFDHPSPEVLSALESISSRVFRTDQQKELHFILEEDFFYLKDKKTVFPF
jgi:competence protein ComEC